MKVSISKGRSYGTILYDEKTKSVLVEFSNLTLDSAIEKYLETKREFRIPESNDIDDFRIEKAYPTDSDMHMKLALCQLHAETGVWVQWETLED